MLDTIKNIYCVGRNYRLHAEELGNAVPTSPFLFSKPTHALVKAEGNDILLPANRGEIHYELEVVVHISKLFQIGMKVDDVVDRMTLGIDLTLRDIQSDLKKKAHPWLLAKGFPNSAVVGEFIPFPGVQGCKQIDFALLKNGDRVQLGNIKEMLFNLQTIFEFTAENFGLGAGDIIYTGTPAGVGPVADGDHFNMLWGENSLGDFKTKLV